MLDKKQFATLFDHAGIGIVIVDPSGEIFAVNKYILQKFGYDESELLHHKVEILIPEPLRAAHVGYREQYAKYPVSCAAGLGREIKLVRKDGSEAIIELALGYYKNYEEVYALVFIDDVTEKKHAEETIRQLNADLEQRIKESTKSLKETVEQLSRQVRENERKDAELMKALAREKELNELKSRFVSIASHEFRTPLSGILASTYLLSRYTKEEEQSQRGKTH